MSGDSYWGNVSLLLHGRGADGSATVIDNSPQAKSVTRNGTVTVSATQAKFGATSLKFPGDTASYLNLDGSAAYAFGTGDWTVEGFLFRNTSGVPHGLVHFVPSQASGAYPEINVTAANVLQFYTAGATRIVGTTTVTTGVWHHFAISRAAGVTRLFLDGVQEGSSYADANNYIVGANRPTIGNGGWDQSNPLNGYLQDLRITKGTGRYTAAFTPPAAAFPDGMGQVSGTVKDSAGAAAARVVRAYRRDVGTLVKELYTSAPDPYIANVILLLHGDGVAGSTAFVDSSPAPKPITLTGSASITSAYKKFGSGAIAFAGGSAANYLSAGTDFALPGDYTVEFFVRWNSTTAGKADNLFSVVTTNGLSVYWDGGKYSANRLRVSNQAVDNPIDYAWAPTVGQMYHIAACRQGTTVRLFIDGVQVASATMATSHPAGEARIGGSTTTASGIGTIDGQIDELRITKGVARYTGAFTPPTDRFADAGTGSTLGSYSFYAPTLDELTLICLDDDAGTVENDLALRVVPA